MHKWRAVAVLSSNLVLHNMQRAAPVSLFDEFRAQWNVDYTAVGALYSAYVISYAVMLSPMGVLAERFDSRKLIVVGTILNLAATVLFAMAPSITWAMFSRLLLGISGSFLYVPSVRYVVAFFDQKNRGKAMGWVQVGGGLGQVLALTLLPAAAVRAGLASAFLIPAVLCLLMLVGQSMWLQSIRLSKIETRAMASIFLVKGFKPFLLFVFLAFTGYYAVMAWLPTYLRRDFGFGAVEAGMSTSLLAVAVMIFSPLAGTVSDRLGARKPVLLVGCALSILCFGILIFSNNVTLVILAALLEGIAMALKAPIGMMLAGEAFASAGAGMALAFTSTTGQTAASISGPSFGYALDVSGSFSVVWAIALACMVGSTMFLTLVQERKWADAPSQGRENS